jgi:hypothetical protein
LLSEPFKHKESGVEGAIDTKWLMLYGMLLCNGSYKEKAVVFYDILQEGG